MKKYYCVLLIFLIIVFKYIYTGEPPLSEGTKDIDFRNNENEISSFSSLLMGEWKIIDVYTVLPSAFEFNRYESIYNYDSLIDDPYIKKIIEPYNQKLINKTVKFTDKEILLDDIKIINAPNYLFEERNGKVYDDDFWWRYRPFRDYFEYHKYYDNDKYYYFNITNDYSTDSYTFDILPKGFIVSEDYIVCPIQDDWIFYILKKQ